ncbi:MAG: PD-(D/E)XK nuclease family protein, partial [Sphingomonas sp.]|nr:PD-(D/E)XK nuclease family protein [Sphingomonas sp.]
DDDLSLASLLVSPLLGWSQDDLLTASVPRDTSLWRHLRARVDAVRLAPLYDLLARADLATPYQLLEHLLSGPLDGRRKLIRRLGAEARDPIEELLSAALEFESRATPSLQAFLDWFDRGEVEIVRDPSAPLDAVRVMTVHGAKGLQAPLVLLADACVDPASAPRSLLRWTPDGLEDPLPIFRPKAAERGGPLDAVLEAAAARDLQEHWRLFYVAATRAEERLVIAGALGPRAQGVPPPASWYAAVHKAFAALGIAGEGEREFRGTTPLKPVAPSKAVRSAPPLPEPVPDWARVSAPVEARPPRPLAPSSLGDDGVADPPPTPALRAAAERGRLIHALLERLPSVDPAARARAADRWLAGAGGVADAAERVAIVDAVVRVLDDGRSAELFGADSLAEAPIAAVIDGGLVVSGTVDRLLVLPDRVRLIDFKTGRRAPASIADVPVYHLRQMAAYAAALRIIFPDRHIEAALLYTAAPVLFELPDSLLAAHKPGLGERDESLASTA